MKSRERERYTLHIQSQKNASYSINHLETKKEKLALSCVAASSAAVRTLCLQWVVVVAEACVKFCSDFNAESGNVFRPVLHHHEYLVEIHLICNRQESNHAD